MFWDEIFDNITLNQRKILKDGLQALRNLRIAETRAAKSEENVWTQVNRSKPKRYNGTNDIEVTSVNLDSTTTNNNSQVSHLTNEVPSPQLKRKTFGGGKRR